MGSTPEVDFAAIGPALASAGYCVYSTTYGTTTLGDAVGGLGPVDASAAVFGTFVDRVRAETDAAQVDIVAHSEGTTVSAYFMKFLDGGRKVHTFVGFGTNYAGTRAVDIGAAGRALDLDGLIDNAGCVACTQFSPGSAFIESLNAGGISVPGPHYINIVSEYDHLVTPYTSGIMPEAPNVTNIVLQNECAADSSGHLGLSYDPNIRSRVEYYLDPAHSPRPGCLPYSSPL